MANDLAIAHGSSPRVSVYPWSSGFGTKYSNPGTLPTNFAINATFSPNAAHLAVGHNTSPNVTAYPFTVGTGFGTKYSDPGTLPGGTVDEVIFSPTTADIA